MTEVAGKVALVTGGGSGIGRGLVLALADAGCSVAVVDLVRQRAEEVADEVVRRGGTAIPLVADVSRREAVAQMKAEANDALGMVGLVFANAGVTWFDPLVAMNDEDVDWVLHVNLMGALYCMQTFLPDMIAAGDGHVVATASIAGLIPGWVPSHTPYSISKAGIIAMMMNLHQELAGSGVGSTVYCPRAIRGRIGESYQHRPAQFGGPIERPFEIHATWAQENAVRLLEPEDVGPMVVQAVLRNAPIVVDHSNQRAPFREHYLRYVEDAFDDAAAWEQAHSSS